MRKLAVFNQVSLDGYFVDMDGDMSWAKNTTPDAELDAFVASNAQSGGTLLFGRITYELMIRYWPTPLAMQHDPAVAEGINALPKFVFSRTLDHVTWNNTTLVKDDMLATVRRMKQESGPDMAILGSGSIIVQLTEERLIDTYQLMVIPLVLGAGRTIFDGLKTHMPLKLLGSRTFGNGNILLQYEPAA